VLKSPDQQTTHRDCRMPLILIESIDTHPHVWSAHERCVVKTTTVCGPSRTEREPIHALICRIVEETYGPGDPESRPPMPTPGALHRDQGPATSGMPALRHIGGSGSGQAAALVPDYVAGYPPEYEQGVVPGAVIIGNSSTLEAAPSSTPGPGHATSAPSLTTPPVSSPMEMPPRLLAISLPFDLVQYESVPAWAPQTSIVTDPGDSDSCHVLEVRLPSALKGTSKPCGSPAKMWG
jgi:hypothetical protein